MKLEDNEDLKNQQLAEVFNKIGSKNEYCSILSSKEHTRKGTAKREDIYFYLSDYERTRVFYLECKRLPKAGTDLKEEYVRGTSTTKKPSGGIERYKMGLHGEPNRLKSNGLIAYIEKYTISKWREIINKNILEAYPDDTELIGKVGRVDEFTSLHKHIKSRRGIIMHHFWIDITIKND